jgi:hypothetical protein
MTDTQQVTHAHDFDFYVGTWTVRNRRLRKALAGCTEWYEFEATSTARAIVGGMGNVDEYEAPSEGIVGFTIRMYDPEHDHWLLYWAGRTGGPLLNPQVGRMEDGRGDFYADDTWEGKPIRVVYRWTVLGDDEARWEQAFSEDGGETWETNWVMESTRTG